MTMIVLIPAYEPGARLEPVVAGLLDADSDLEVVVVDDGSGPGFAETFTRVEALGARVLRHDANRGKGAALKTGLDYVMATHPGNDVVTADADGQHTVHDILRVADALREDAAVGTPTLVLGCRSFTGRVPVRSRAGNALARAVFRLAAGWSLTDSQTGLRGIPSDLLGWVRGQPGERLEFEQNVLLRCRRDGVTTREIPIETVYLEGNASSHFRPLVDSARVALPLVLFAGSSLLAFAVDTVALLILNALTGLLVPSIVAARVLSASVNFAVNRHMVFRGSMTSPAGRGRMPGQALRYALLAVALLASNVVWLEALTGFGIPLIVAKIATEAVLFVTSYGVQRSFVFREHAGGRQFRPAPDTRPSNHQGAATGMESERFTIRRNP
ncbi:bifunctional glycosyltransferase family 2/GtrA family protein [Microbacterium telephonicum]|uniref:Glycosyltransferase involved in cell wall biosynthesis n=1 Tax=Microbacterium telephonicum TaxID=1714841 RepID=A0A498CK70_9MICO|nr:bifunctional glycosyltransferase family 2/GtrA family protein [Microbacterium telephonicum]RLK52541.1 glycosyltransferase involved in cell wall biosynthesis [Microbacterium telephonicum]